MRKDTFAFSWESVIYKGKTYMIPYASQVNLLFYRSDRYADAGLKAPDIGSHMSWEEFLTACQRLTKAPDQWGVAASITKGGVATIFSMFLWSAGCEYMKQEGGEWRVKFGPEGKKAVTFWNDLFNKYKVMPLASMELGSSGLRNGFMQGNFSQMIGQEYYIGILNAEGGPDFQWNKQWKAQGMPVDKYKKISIPRTVGMAIAENSKNKEAAWMLVDFLTSAEAQKIWWTPNPKLGGLLPARTSVIKDAQYARDDYEWPLIRSLVLDKGYHHNLPIHPGFKQFSDQIFGIGVHKMLLGEMTVDQTIKFIEDEGNKVIAEFKQFE